MKLNHMLVASTLALFGSAALAQASINDNVALAGNLTPGDAPGYPVTISHPGHYRLTGNLTVPAGTIGIDITAANVTLDLNGFTVGGPVTCTQNFNTKAVTCSAPSDFNVKGIQAVAENVVVRNGTVRGFAGYGIYLSSSGYVLEQVAAISNSYSGAVVGTPSGHPGRISGSSFSLNGSRGAVVNGGGLAVNSTFSKNNTYGLDGEGMVIVDSQISLNGNRGIRGDSHNPGAGVIGIPSTLRGTTLLNNKNGATEGYLTSLGGNFNGSAPF